MKHPVQWLTASPLWTDFDSEVSLFRRPALLTFASDDFMDDLTQLLEQNPRQLVSHVAKSESEPRPLPVPALKLFQPTHGHFNLVASSLVCRQVGLPDRSLNQAEEEKVSFVLRRLSSLGEEAWLPGNSSGTWQPLNANEKDRLAPDEEQLPLFPIRFVEEGPRSRRVFVGLVPTSSRDTFAAAKRVETAPPPGTPRTPDSRLVDITERVLETLDQMKSLREPLQGPALDQQRDVSQFILLDLAEFLVKTFPRLKVAIEGGEPIPRNDPSFTIQLILSSANADGSTKWLAALQHVWRERDRITTGRSPTQPVTYNLKNSDLSTSALRRAIEAALEKTPRRSDSQERALLPKLGAKADSGYIIRCVYQRPHCGLQRDVISEPTESFRIAPYFDPEAPARPIRISLPVDTTIAGLRKAKKNVSFVISNQLRQQMSRATDLQKVLDGDLDEGKSFDLGEICSFSIPIITICAFIVLMIFLVLLNIVFWWLPFLRICLPIPLKKD